MGTEAIDHKKMVEDLMICYENVVNTDEKQTIDTCKGEITFSKNDDGKIEINIEK